MYQHCCSGNSARPACCRVLACGCSALQCCRQGRRRQCAERSQMQIVLLQLFQQRVCGVCKQLELQHAPIVSTACVCPGEQGLHVFDGVPVHARRLSAGSAVLCCAVLSQVSMHLGLCRVCRREQLLYLACMRVRVMLVAVGQCRGAWGSTSTPFGLPCLSNCMQVVCGVHAVQALRSCAACEGHMPAALGSHPFLHRRELS
jgi:hypothetical protein